VGASIFARRSFARRSVWALLLCSLGAREFVRFRRQHNIPAVGVVFCDRYGRFGGIFAQVFLIDNSVLADKERHNSRILGLAEVFLLRVGNFGEHAETTSAALLRCGWSQDGDEPPSV